MNEHAAVATLVATIREARRARRLVAISTGTIVARGAEATLVWEALARRAREEVHATVWAS
jgi:hypothetical protein